MATVHDFPVETTELLIRAHIPFPGVSVVRPAGTITAQTGAVIAEHMKMRLDGADDHHVVLDLQDTTAVGATSEVVEQLRRMAADHAVELHVPDPRHSVEELIEQLRPDAIS